MKNVKIFFCSIHDLIISGKTKNIITTLYVYRIDYKSLIYN